jgi:NADH:ubiquinone oxidoreductase subunit 2 (subunit N)
MPITLGSTLWNLTDKRLFSILAVSLAGLPRLAGFLGLINHTFFVMQTPTNSFAS